jgi:hypothetical protein
MKVNQYNWNWWFVLSTIGFIVLVNLSGFLPIQLPEENEISLTILWIIWFLQFLVCMYIGMKPSDDN